MHEELEMYKLQCMVNRERFLAIFCHHKTSIVPSDTEMHSKINENKHQNLTWNKMQFIAPQWLLRDITEVGNCLHPVNVLTNFKNVLM
jgi:hypothetical protein